MKHYIDQQDRRIKRISFGHDRWYSPDSGIWNERYMSEKKDVLTRGRNNQELRIIIANLPRHCRTILDAPCGYGRISNLLASKNYQLVGIDINKYFIRIAQQDATQRRNSVRYLVGNILTKQINKKFDAVLNIFTSIGYLETEEKNELLIKKLCNYVKPGGRLIIETMNPIAMFRRYEERSNKVTNDGKVFSFRRYYDYKTATMTTRVRETRSKKLKFSGAHIIRLYFPHELVEICNKYGCEIDQILDQRGHDGDIMDSLRMWLIFTKRKQ
ncbi:MAG: class I SAM-dependent methyltransferase [Candidatus Kerfeldbacteria bacterium]|nr:class I SAM-dependent methyltransferase [Candidatus Kerfeldbacteria bacterium]